MSERERWVVYPLLFLALGAALRDKLFDRTTTKSIVCQELTVVDEEPTGQRPVRILAQIGRDPSMRGTSSGAYMVVNGQLDADLINAKQYAFRNVPFVPALQTIMSYPMDALRALQQSVQPQRLNTNSQPRAQSGDQQEDAPAESPRADSPGTPDAPRDSDTRTDSAPLAAPPENR
jgi:hypothetical protein